MLFKKKKEIKETVVIPKLDRGFLAESISIYLDIFKKCIIDYKRIEETIPLNDSLRLEIHDVYRECFLSQLRYYMSVDIFIENIFIETCKFVLYVGYRYSSEKYRKWDCTEIKSSHHIPHSVVHALNDWSSQVFSNFINEKHKKQREAEVVRRQEYEREEAILSKYWK